MNQASQSNHIAAIIGGGVIGGGWAARFLLHGWRVKVYDPHPQARSRVEEVLENARVSLPALADVAMPAAGKLSFVESLDVAVSGANWIQESVPEDLALKHKVIKEIENHAPASAIIASSTSGFKPSQLQEAARHPERILVAHPFNPVYLLPLVEVVAASAKSVEIIERACAVLTSIGMKPLVVRKEIDAHLADRLLEAMWREALWLIKDDIASTEEIDDAIRYGFGLRWGQMGMFETYRLAGGEAGMAHFIGQFGPALHWPWSRLTDVPELDDELVQKIADQSDAQARGRSLRELEGIRDRNLVGMMRSLKERDWGVGEMLNQHDRYLGKLEPEPPAFDVDADRPTRMLELSVLPGWIDQNGHMTEFRYVQVFSDSCDRLLSMIGAGPDYIAEGHSYYTAESHIMHIDEVGVNKPIYSTAQIMHADTKRLHVFFCLRAGEDDRVLASAEEMYLHVDMQNSRVCEADPDVVGKAIAIAEAHALLPRPAVIGRHVGQRNQET